MSNCLADLDLALRAAAAAGGRIMRWFGHDHEVMEKGPDQPLTEADLEADRVLKEMLHDSRPDYGWLSEETADSPDRLERERVWIVDPIDGTRSFIAGHPEFALSIGLVRAGRAVLGVVYNPASAEIFWAVRGDGAYGAALPPPAGGGAGGRTADSEPDRGSPPGAVVVRALGGGDIEALAVTPRSTADQAMLLASRSEIAAGEFDPFHGGWRVQPTGSTAYKMARVAAGHADVFLSRGPKSEWDVCAGGLLVEEAGGTATDLRGRALRYNHPDPAVYGILTSNGKLHRYVMAVVESLPVPPRLAERAEDPLHPGLDEREGE